MIDCNTGKITREEALSKMSKKYDITKHPNYKYLSDYNPKNAFSIEEFLSTRLKPKKDEQFINYEISAEELARYS